MFGREKLALIIGEFLGTTGLALVVLSVARWRSLPYFMAVAGGLAAATFMYTFRSHANPAVTLGLWTIRKVQTVEAFIRVAIQMAAGLVAWQLCEYLLNSPLNNIAERSFSWRTFTAEAIGGLVVGLGAAAAYNVTRPNEARRAIQIGVAYGLAIMVASLAANGLVNPALALGLQSWSWSYVLGPLAGASVGATLYVVCFSMPAQGPVTVSARGETTKIAKPKVSKAKVSGRPRRTAKSPARR